MLKFARWKRPNQWPGAIGRAISILLTKIRMLTSASPLMALASIFMAGIVFWGGFNWTMELTNAESFCISCHAMEKFVYPEYKKTIHYNNRTGVRATCADCHVPKEWIHKVKRKIQATNELFHWFAGSIDTAEKFKAKRAKLARYVWSSMKKTDSRECRNCHEIGHMAAKVQKRVAAKMHELGVKWKMTCIDCHKGIMHEIPEAFNRTTFMDQLHERFDKEKVPCHDCHEGMTRAKAGDRW